MLTGWSRICRVVQDVLAQFNKGGLIEKCLNEVSMTYLVNCDWSETSVLDLAADCLNDAAVMTQHHSDVCVTLSHNGWRKLRIVNLRFQSKLTNEAVRLLRIEQQHVARF